MPSELHTDNRFFIAGAIVIVTWALILAVCILNWRLTLRACKDKERVARALFFFQWTAFLGVESASKKLGVSLEDMKIMRRYQLYTLVETVSIVAVLMPLGGIFL